MTPSSEINTSPYLHRKLRIRTIHSSLLIEGNALSEDQVTAIIDGKRVLGDAKDVREVENAHRAYELIDSIDPFDVSDLLRIHGVMMDGLIKDAGNFRSKNVGVYDGDALIYAGTPAHYVPEVMADLFGWITSTKVHPLISSCIFHYEFEFVHPFADGNGRCGRLWYTLLLSKWRPVLKWSPIESIIQQRQQEYYAAIAASNASGSCEAFVAFMLEAIRDSILPYAIRKSDKDVRKEQLVKAVSDDPHVTIPQLMEKTGFSRRSIERDLTELKESGVLTRLGSARSGSWEVNR
ncbi:Fic family protein [Paraeggerthella sp.]|uniref:Fic family protein n=1 Tax=Paraeggerthella sp. TaxID=2897350 RepID=UPI00215D73CD